MGAVRTGLLVLYLVGTYVLSNYLRDRLPTASGRLPSPGIEMWRALFWIWAPMLWFFPGVLWIGLLGLPWPYIVILSLLIPLSCLSLFLALSGVFTADNASMNGPVVAVTVGIVGIFTALVAAVAMMTHPDLHYARFALFCVGQIVPSLVSIWFLAIWSREVVPLPDDVDRPTWSAFAMVLGFFSGSPKPVWMVEDAKIHTRISGSALSGIGPGLVVTEPENVVVMRAGAKLTRVAGPGAVLTQKGEVPFRVVDLRNQVRSTRVDAITRDGIEVQMPVSSEFRIARGQEEVKLGAGWPYRTQRDVLQALFSEEVDPTGRSPLDTNTANPWEDLPVELAAHKLEQVLSFYSLDQLYAGITEPGAAEIANHPQSALLQTHRRAEEALGLPASEKLGDVLSRLTIGKLVTRTVKQVFQSRGLEILGGRVGQAPEPLNRGVTEQRVEAWKSRFITKVMDWQASLERQRFKALGKIRRQAREQLLAEMIDQTSQRLETARPEVGRDSVAVHLLDNLIQIAENPQVQKMLPESALPTLEYVYQQVGGSRAPGESP